MQVAKLTLVPKPGGSQLTFESADPADAPLEVTLTQAQVADLTTQLVMSQLDAMADAPSGAEFAMPPVGGIQL